MRETVSGSPTANAIRRSGPRIFDSERTTTQRFSFECTGVAQAVQTAINVCGHLGTVCLLGMPMEPATIFTPVISVKEQRLVSIAGPSMESMAEAMQLLLRRPQIASALVSVVPLAGTERAMQALADGNGGLKVLVDVTA